LAPFIAAQCRTKPRAAAPLVTRPRPLQRASAAREAHALGLTIILNLRLNTLFGGSRISVHLMPKSPSQIARSLRALHNADRLGLVRCVRILPGPNACEAVVKQFASEYPANAMPSLPLPQCTNDRCQCKYVPIGSEKFRRLCATEKPPSKLLH